MTVPGRVRSARALVPFLLLATLLAAPVRAADTEDKLKAAKARYERVLAQANIATAKYEEARALLIATRDEMQETQEKMAVADRRMNRLRRHLDSRAREAYLMGPTSSLELLLTARSFTEFSDRMVFLDQLAQDDADLVTQVSVTEEILRRLRADLDRQAEVEAKAVSEAKRHLKVVYERLEEAQAIKDKLVAQVAAERKAAAALLETGGVAIVQGQALQACPVPGSSFVDSWGAPRSGGRSHQGVDMMAPYGTPIHAAQSGSVAHSSSDLGGIQAYVYGDGGDTTFYAHLQGYSDVPSGAHVSAGTVIGYVGDTGNATGTPHLHFEYHPGGGGAVNPYPYVRAVC